MNVTWWCAAGSAAWTWSPQAYPGVWAFVLGIGVAYALALRRLGPRRAPPGEPSATRAQLASFAVGYLLLWLALDWPVGALGAGYLLSAHMVQYVTLSLVTVPLLVHGMPPWMQRALVEPRALRPLRALATRPFGSFVFFNGVLVATHLPLVADTLKPLQLGSMAMDLLWIVAALGFWLSLTGNVRSAAPPVVYGRRFLYVVGIKVLPIFLGVFFVFAEFPLYRTYELAPRAVERVTALDDQILAGVLMWMGTTPILLFRMATAFFAWHALETQRAGEV